MPDSRRPITFSLLESTFDTLPDICSSIYEIWLFRSAFELALLGTLRINEMVTPSKKCLANLRIFDDLLTGSSFKIFI